MAHDRGARPRAGVLIPTVWGSGEPWWLALLDAARVRGVDLVAFAGHELSHPYDFRSRANAVYDLVAPRRLDGLVVFTAALGRYVGARGAAQLCRRLAPLPLVSVGHEIAGYPSLPDPGDDHATTAARALDLLLGK